jgi:succinyl-CoA synthetase alpha subunit
MCILVDEDSRVVVQGITGNVGSFQTKLMLDYGTKVLAGVTPGRGGLRVHGLPVLDTMKEAVMQYEVGVSVSFVPAASARDASIEAIESGIDLLVMITEHIPVHDAMWIKERGEQAGVRIIGPTTPGIICPGKTKIGIMPAEMFSDGNVGIVSRSGTLLYEIAGTLSFAGMGQSSCLGIGADPVVGTNMVEVLRLFEQDEHTKLVVLVGEIGGVQEDEAARFIERKMTKPVVAYIAGKTAPLGERMGHAGAIILGERGKAEKKIEALKNAGVRIADRPSDIPEILKWM